MGSDATDSMKFLPIPTKTGDITVGWLSAVLKCKVDGNSFAVAGGANVGLGFLGDIVRVKYSENLQDGSTKEHFIIIKLLPTTDSVRELVVSEKMDKAEIYFYQKFVSELLEHIPSLEAYLCPAVYADIQEKNPETKTDYNSILILKDMKNEGFITKAFVPSELSDEEVDLTMDFLAKFHLAGRLIEFKKKSTLPEMYDFFNEWFIPNKDKKFTMQTWFNDGFTQAKNVITKHINASPSDRELGMELIDKMLNRMAPHSQKIFQAFVQAGQQYPTAIHGDLWQNNILTKAAGQPSIKVIDWQMTGYTDPVADLGEFLCLSLLPNITMDRVEKFAKSYFDEYQRLYSEKERAGVIPNKSLRSWENFWQSLKTFGFTMAFIQFIASTETIGISKNPAKAFALLRFLHYEAHFTDFWINHVS